MTNSDQDTASNFGDVDLTNCDREPIHVLGRIQSFGALISVSSDWIINHASKNAKDFLGLETGEIVGSPLSEVFTQNAIHAIRSRLQMLSSADSVERMFGVQLTAEPALYDVAVHFSGRSIIIECERHNDEKTKDYVSYVRPMIERISKAENVVQLCDIAARQLSALIGFDRVMVYKFAKDDTGVVIAETKNHDMESFKGLRYPASDIPKQARALYTRNLLRIISDVGDPGVEIYPATSPEGAPLDLSLSTTRAVSPIHLEYLRNMGVRASLSVSILKRGKLWGLFACHNETPQIVSFEKRSAAELFGQLFSFVLDQKESDLERAERDRSQIVHDKLMAQLADDASVSKNFQIIAQAIESVIPYDGAIGWIEGHFESIGQTLTREEFLPLVKTLNRTTVSQIFQTDCIASVTPDAEKYAERAAGLLALPVSRNPRDYIVLFRKEIARSVQWAGNPNKPVELGPNGARLTPRKSFEAWKEIVRNTCQPWSEAEVRAAESLRMTLLEVVLRMTDASLKERAKSQERQEILIAELNHRVRNILTLIRGLVSQADADATSVAEFTEVVGGRIHALARAHDQISQENWSPGSAQKLIKTEASAYFGEKAGRVSITGPDAMLSPTAFSTLALVIHELMTNSAKYGALCDSGGSLSIELEALDDGALGIVWKEIDGPPIETQPTRRGFGSTIIERSIPFELDGEASIAYERSGVRAEFKIPATYVAEIFDTQTFVAETTPTAPEVKTPLSGNVLLVEDNIIISLDAEKMLTDLGAEKVFVAARVQRALKIMEDVDLSFALLDINLGAETSEAIAHALKAKSVLFAFATGYGEETSLTAAFPDVQIVQKPYSLQSLERAVSKTLSQSE